MKIAFFELEGWEPEIIKRAFPEHELFFSPLSASDYFGEMVDFDAISVFVNSKLDKQVLQKFPHLRFVTARCTGYDHIDLVACAERNIIVSYVPGYGDNTVAEFAFGLILNLTRKMYGAINQVKETGSFDFKNFRGIDLKGKTIGIIGTGRIGKEAIHIAKGFEMNVLAYDLYPNEEYAKTAGIRYVPLNELLQNADVISLHAPYTKETHHIINMENITQVKHGSYLVNTARGGLVETDALVYALQNKILAGAGLDVLEEEGVVKDEMKFLRERSPDEHTMKTVLENHLLMGMQNVLITPHNAFNSQEALERILNTTLKNIEGFTKGSPINTIACKNK
jgi:D-lactate dehydrogenase